MNEKISLALTIGLLTAACGGGDRVRPDQQQYETVQEGSAAGVTATIAGPGETLPPLTGTNADTTTAFDLDTNALPPSQPGATEWTTDPAATATTATWTPPTAAPAPTPTPPPARTTTQEPTTRRPAPAPRPVEPAPRPRPEPEKPEPAPPTETTPPSTTSPAPPPTSTSTSPPPPTTTDTDPEEPPGGTDENPDRDGR